MEKYEFAQSQVELAEMAYELYLQGDIDEKEFHTARAEAEKAIADLEWQKMLSAPEDAYGCVIEINAGAGGTEAQDWAAMLARMYTLFAQKKGWKVQIVDELEGEGAG